jgi:hypothetical protein
VPRTIQYVRCTIQKPSEEVAACVEENAQKVDWLPQMQVYEGASSCPNIDKFLILLGLTILRTAISTFLEPPASHLFQSLWKQWRAKKGNLPVQYDSFWATAFKRETYYHLKALKVVQVLGRSLLTSYLSSLAIKQGARFLDPGFLEAVALFLVRPRAAPFIGILGLFQPWSKHGIAYLVVDGILSYLAGTFVGVHYMVLIISPSPNPAAPPPRDLKILSIGAIMTFAPYMAVLAIILLTFVIQALATNSFLAFFVTLMHQLLKGAVFLSALPLIALWEISAAIANKFWYSKRQRRRGFTQWKTPKWLEPLSTDNPRFRIIYYFLILSSWCINIGNWIFWASYLKLDGELWCPINVRTVVVIWFLVPAAIDFVFWLFDVLTNDSSNSVVGLDVS